MKRREIRLVDGVEHLCCSKCGEWKSVLGFGKRGEKYKDGSIKYMSQCKECRKEYYENNKEESPTCIRSRKGREVRLIDGVEHLCCSKCGEWKPVLGFSKQGKYKDGLVKYESHCKECRKEYNKQYYENNKEKEAERHKRYYENNKEKKVEYDKQYYKNNKEKEAKRQKQWRENNKEYQKQHYKNNKESYYIRSHNRRAKERALQADLTASEYSNIVNNVFNGKCVLSGKENLSKEHFIPISWGCEGNTIGNVYPMDLSLNISKRAQNPFDWIKTQPEHYQEQFYNVLVPYLADLNEMTPEEYQDYVYFCEANKRTLEETEADTKAGITMLDKFEQFILENV